jgi:hypothetical protein
MRLLQRWAVPCVLIASVDALHLKLAKCINSTARTSAYLAAACIAGSSPAAAISWGQAAPAVPSSLIESVIQQALSEHIDAASFSRSQLEEVAAAAVLAQLDPYSSLIPLRYVAGIRYTTNICHIGGCSVIDSITKSA